VKKVDFTTGYRPLHRACDWHHLGFVTVKVLLSVIESDDNDSICTFVWVSYAHGTFGGSDASLRILGSN